MSDWYRAIGPLLRTLEPETAHRLTLGVLKTGLFRPTPRADDPILRQELWGRTFSNPIGLAAGFDKNGEVPDAMLRLGFGFVEIGSVTPRPQAGNPRPRMFRLPEDEAVINRLGFNSDGLAAVRLRLAARPRQGVVGVNLGKNRDSADAAADYAAGAAALAPFADYLVCNVSSPNTPGLRALQSRDALDALVAAVQQALATAMAKDAPPLLLKIAPDLTLEDMRDIAAVALERKLAGLVVSNTTIARPPTLKSRHRAETGGLSGKPLFAPSTDVLRAMYRLLDGRLPLIGVGGIASGNDAYRKIRAGASLVQLYTALVFQGPYLVADIRRDLAARLRADGLARLHDAVGLDAR